MTPAPGLAGEALQDGALSGRGPGEPLLTRVDALAATLRLWPEIGAMQSDPEVRHLANHLVRHGRLLAEQLRCLESSRGAGSSIWR